MASLLCDDGGVHNRLNVLDLQFTRAGWMYSRVTCRSMKSFSIGVAYLPEASCTSITQRIDFHTHSTSSKGSLNPCKFSYLKFFMFHFFPFYLVLIHVNQCCGLSVFPPSKRICTRNCLKIKFLGADMCVKWVIVILSTFFYVVTCQTWIIFSICRKFDLNCCVWHCWRLAFDHCWWFSEGSNYDFTNSFERKFSVEIGLLTIFFPIDEGTSMKNAHNCL